MDYTHIAAFIFYLSLVVGFLLVSYSGFLTFKSLSGTETARDKLTAYKESVLSVMLWLRLIGVLLIVSFIIILIT